MEAFGAEEVGVGLAARVVVGGREIQQYPGAAGEVVAAPLELVEHAPPTKGKNG